MINALKYTKDLETVSFSRPQAEKVVNVLWEVMDQNFATKDDLLILKSEMRTEFAEFREEVKVDMANLRTDMKKMENSLILKLGAMMGTMFTLSLIIIGMMLQA